MNIGSKDLDALRETASKALIALLWLHVPIALAIGMARGADWLLPTLLTVALATAPRCPGAPRAMGFRPISSLPSR